MWYVLFVYVRVCVHMCLCVKASSWHPVSPSLLSSLLFGMKSLTALNLLIQLDSWPWNLHDPFVPTSPALGGPPHPAFYVGVGDPNSGP